MRMTDNICLLTGDCLETLKQYPDNHFDSLVTDPPYGLSEHGVEDIIACLTAWLAGETYQHSKSGFMNKEWDAFVPGPEVWREVYRVLKPGAFGVVFAGTRTSDLMGVSLRLAGFERRDTLAWVFGAGFPKSTNIGKAIDKAAGAEREVVGLGRFAARKPRGTWTGEVYGDEPAHGNGPLETAPATPEAARWKGWGTALKPAHEPILLVQKPREGTYAANVLKYGVGGLNIDGCRVQSGEATCRTNSAPSHFAGAGEEPGLVNQTGSNQGRFPPNVLLGHSPNCRVVGFRTVKGDSRAGGGNKLWSHYRDDKEPEAETIERLKGKRPGGFGDVGSENGDPQPAGTLHGDETVPVYECDPSCPVNHLQEQVGVKTSGKMKAGTPYPGGTVYGAPSGASKTDTPGDSGTVDRFYPQFEADVSKPTPLLEGDGLDRSEPGSNRFEPNPHDPGFFYTGKAPRTERDDGCDDLEERQREESRKEGNPGGDNPRNRGVNKRSNFHPCVKPTSLMKWLCRLITPPGGTILDPFTGSGSTGVAALAEGFGFVGVELDPDYMKIAEGRIEGARKRVRYRPDGSTYMEKPKKKPKGEVAPDLIGDMFGEK